MPPLKSIEVLFLFPLHAFRRFIVEMTKLRRDEVGFEIVIPCESGCAESAADPEGEAGEHEGEPMAAKGVGKRSPEPIPGTEGHGLAAVSVQLAVGTGNKSFEKAGCLHFTCEGLQLHEIRRSALVEVEKPLRFFEWGAPMWIFDSGAKQTRQLIPEWLFFCYKLVEVEDHGAEYG